MSAVGIGQRASALVESARETLEEVVTIADDSIEQVINNETLQTSLNEAFGQLSKTDFNQLIEGLDLESLTSGLGDIVSNLGGTLGSLDLSGLASQVSSLAQNALGDSSSQFLDLSSNLEAVNFALSEELLTTNFEEAQEILQRLNRELPGEFNQMLRQLEQQGVIVMGSTAGGLMAPPSARAPATVASYRGTPSPTVDGSGGVLVRQSGVYIIGDSHAAAMGGANNSGVNGARLSAIAVQARNVPRGSQVVMTGGHNDVAYGRSSSQIASDVNAIIEDLKNKDCTITYVLFPIGSRNSNQENMAPTRQAIRSAISGVTIIDLNDYPMSSDGRHNQMSVYRSLSIPNPRQPQSSNYPERGSGSAGGGAGGSGADGSTGRQPGRLAGTRVSFANSDPNQVPRQQIIDSLNEMCNRLDIDVRITPQGGWTGRDTGTQNHPTGFAADFQVIRNGAPSRPTDEVAIYRDCAQTLQAIANEKGIRPGLGSYRWGLHYDESPWRQNQWPASKVAFWQPGFTISGVLTA